MSKAKAPVERFIALPHALVNSDRWKALHPGAVVLLLQIWTRFNGRNNGEISFSQREAETMFGWGSHTAVRRFAELQEAGFLVAVEQGSFNRRAGVRGQRATTWSIPQAKETKKNE